MPPIEVRVALSCGFWLSWIEPHQHAHQAMRFPVQRLRMSSPPLKRHRLDSNRDISPPPLRRRKTGQETNNHPRGSQATATESNHIANQPKIAPLDDRKRLSVISWNVNGITHLLPKTQKSIKDFLRRSSPQDEAYGADSNTESSLRRFLRRHEFPQLLCLQEVKISPKDEKTRCTVEKAANEGLGPQYIAHFSLPRDKFNAKGWGGKVYGVCNLVRNDLPKSVTREIDWDLEGRVLITTIEEWKLSIINGYWVNGTMNPYRDSATGYLAGTRHDRKREFHKLMLGEVKNLEKDGYHVLLVGDMNVARSALDGYPGIRLGEEHVLNRRDFNAKFFDDEDGMRGVDTWRYMHGETRGYTYHGESAEEWGRSCDRVDLGIASRSLVEKGALVAADIWESVEERGGSDHVPLGVKLGTKALIEERSGVTK